MTVDTTTQPSGAQTTESAPATSTDTSAPASATPAQTTDATPAQTTPTADTPASTTTEDKPADAKPQGAPEAYDLKAPEGAAMDDAGIAAFAEFAKGQNLTQEAAQSMLTTLAPAMAKRAQDQAAAIHAQWLADTKADKEIGGDKLDENLAVAKKARDAFATEGFRDFLEQTKLGDHPEMVRFLNRVGKAMSEDSLVTSGGGKKTPEMSAAQRMYPNMNP